MEKYTQEQQTEIVKKARNLTAAIQVETAELKKLRQEKYKDMPQAPVRATVKEVSKILPKYPEAPKTTYSYSEFLKDSLKKVYQGHKNIVKIAIGVIAVLLIVPVIKGSGFSVISGLIVMDIIMAAFLFPAISLPFYLKKKKSLNEALANTPEHLNAIAKAEKEAEELNIKALEKSRAMQKQFDETYEKEKEHYDKVVVPEYKDALMLWTSVQEKKIEIIEEDLQLNKETLKNLYEKTKIISSTYRELWILSWLYEDMRTSDHDIRYATELLDRDRQRIITAESGRLMKNAVDSMHSDMMIGFNGIYSAIEEGNEIQEEMLYTLSKTRRDINIGNFVGTVQRHKTNKILNEMRPKKKK